MGFWRLGDRHALVQQSLVPSIYVVHFVNYKAYVVQPVLFLFVGCPGIIFVGCPGIRYRHSVQGQIVVAGAQKHVIGVGLPLDGHANDVGIEAEAVLKGGDIQSDVTHP